MLFVAEKLRRVLNPKEKKSRERRTWLRKIKSEGLGRVANSPAGQLKAVQTSSPRLKFDDRHLSILDAAVFDALLTLVESRFPCAGAGLIA